MCTDECLLKANPRFIAQNEITFLHFILSILHWLVIIYFLRTIILGLFYPGTLLARRGSTASHQPTTEVPRELCWFMTSPS